MMTDPERGACVSAIEGDGLLIDPTVKDAKDAIKSAYQRAAKDEATLFIAYIGHGERSGEDFYLLPPDAENPPESDTAVHLINLIKETHRKAPGRVDGLGVLVDACYSGMAGFGAAQAWVSGLRARFVSRCSLPRPTALPRTAVSAGRSLGSCVTGSHGAFGAPALPSSAPADRALVPEPGAAAPLVQPRRDAVARAECGAHP